MRRFMEKAKTAFLTLVLFSLGAGLCSAPAYAAGGKKVTEAKNGVVSVQFWIKDAYYCAVVNGQLEPQAVRRQHSPLAAASLWESREKSLPIS